MGGNGFLVSDYLRDVIESCGYELFLCTEWDNATKKWSLEEWPDDMAACDVILCPQRVDVQPGKSSVKATTAMALGLPVIASPLQAYKEIITHGENGFIAETKEEWGEALRALKDVKVRRRVGKAAKKSIAPYRLENNVQNYINFFDSLVNGTARLQHAEAPVKEEKARDVVDLVIPNYNNLEYLKLCLSSIRLNTVHPFHIVVSDAGSDTETWEYLRTLKGITVLGEEGARKTFSETCNAGIRSSRSKFFVIMNSDVVVSKGWLGNMVKHMETVHRLASCGVLSNCDRGWLHGAPGKPQYPMRLEKAGIDLHPGMKLQTIAPHLDELYEFMDASNKKYKNVFQPQEWVAAYATIFARSAVNEVGLFDTRFKNGCEDLDLCMRLGKAGFACGQSIGSFVFHFGGISRAAYQEEGKEEYDREDRENHAILKQKWAKKRIAIWTGPAWEPWNRQKVDEGMAGSETWASYLSRAFVKKGYEVTIYNDLLADSKDDVVLDPVLEEGVDYGAVRYVDHTKMMEDIQYLYIDYFISSRSCEPMKQSLHSGRNYVMVHDIWLNPDPNYDVMAWKVQGYAYLSDWHKEFLCGRHKQLPPEKMFLTANGVVQDLYSDVDDSAKDNCSVYSSSPDRGLYQLLQMMPEIRKAVPDFKLKVAYGFYNWESAVKRRNDQRGMAFIQKIKASMSQPGVEYLDRVDKSTLAEHQRKANVWLYPTWFDETFCCLPTNEVYTDSGFKPIVEMTLEDKVLTHEGRFMGVHKLMKRPYKGTVHALSCKNNSGALSYFTPEHPMLCLKSKDANAIRRQKYGDYKAAVLEKDPEWINAGDVKVGDYVCFPEYRSNSDAPAGVYDPLPDYQRVNRNYRVIRGRIKTRDYDEHRGVPSMFPMTTSFARFLGLYFAEGSFGQSVVRFSFHSDENEHLEFVRSYAEGVLGIPSHVDDSSKDNGAVVVVNSYTLGMWLKQQFGHSAALKTVPGFVIQQDESFRKEFVAAAFDGGGHFGVNDNKIQLSTKRGVMNLRMVMFSLGMRPSLLKPSIVRGRKYYTLSVAKGQWDRCFKGSYDGKEQRTCLEHGGKVFYKVKEILSKKYDGFVYNMEVDGDNSYVSDFLAVHNCIGAVENGLSHNPILSTDRAGLKTTVGSSGILIPGDGLPMDAEYPREYTERFVAEAVKLLTDADHRREWADKARAKMIEYSWDKIADGWISQFGEN